MERSLWLAEVARSRFGMLREPVEVDVAVIGAGLTGLLIAERLRRQGKSVAVLDRYRVCGGCSGHSTAMATALLDAGYTAVERKFGPDGARVVAATLVSAIEDLSVHKDVARLAAYHYAHAESAVVGLTDELEAARRAGLDATFVQDVPLRDAEHGGLAITNQAQLNPATVCADLATRLARGGCLIFEDTPVTSIAEGEPCELETPHARLRASDVVMATHTPLGFSFLQTEVAPYRSYVIAARVATPLPRAVFFDTSVPYFYVRAVADDLVLVGGADHKTGSGEAGYPLLEDMARRSFDVLAIPVRWSSQFYEPADGLPYIGRLHGHQYVATGFAGDGIVFAAVAARVISDLISGVASAAADIYSPTRVKPVAGAKRFVKENIDVARHFVADRLSREDLASLDDVRRGEGRLVQLGMRKVAAYRDNGGGLHVLSPVCSHMRCIVHFNAAETSWDCPCHGGRFDVDGKPIDGPPVTALKPYDLEEPRKSERSGQVVPQPAS